MKLGIRWVAAFSWRKRSGAGVFHAVGYNPARVRNPPRSSNPRTHPRCKNLQSASLLQTPAAGIAVLGQRPDYVTCCPGSCILISDPP